MSAPSSTAPGVSVPTSDIDLALGRAASFGAVDFPTVERILAAHAAPRTLDEYVAEETAQRIEQMLGLQLPAADVVQMLSALGLGVSDEASGSWLVQVPSHRFDISLEVDLIEELGRLYGYDRLPVRYPQARLAPEARPEARAELPALRRLLVARGYQEAITYSFVDPRLLGSSKWRACSGYVGLCFGWA